MYSIYGSAITLTRSDTFMCQIEIYKDGELYQPSGDDVVRFALKKVVPNVPKSEAREPLLTKVIPNDTLLLQLDPEDTAELLFGQYTYDIQITFGDTGAVDTFIADADFFLTLEVE